MIQISNIRLRPGFSEREIEEKLRRERIPEGAAWHMQKLSLDARKKEDIHYRCAVTASFPGEGAFLRRSRSRDVGPFEPLRYQIPASGTGELPHRPVIIGAGPAGLFAGRLLAEAGYGPLILERGAPVEERRQDVERFWREGILEPDSNVQFGEGGAGTFSDGKLATQVKERNGRIRQVLTWFVEAGADPSILYWNKPHIGTDVLQTVVRQMRERFLALGGEIRFHTRMERLLLKEDGAVRGVLCRLADGSVEEIPAEAVILAVGHSARDTFEELLRERVPMEAKSFAVGVRIEHPQEDLDLAQYGRARREILPAADYKLTGTAPDGRGVYSFCMCPGGQVVNASSEPERLAVNGMSRAARDGRNANSALVVTVGPEDLGADGPLAGVAFQRRLEHLAWELGEGRIPVQLLADFVKNTPSRVLGEVEPDLCGAYRLGNLRQVLPAAVGEGLSSLFPVFGRRIRGYDRPDAVLSGVESRTSSPVRIRRGEHFESEQKGLFPCGEGAGYAGGITSAAVDGMKVAEEIIRRYRCPAR